MVEFTLLHPKATTDHLGLIPLFLSETAPGSAAFQLNYHYQHGGGWRPMSGWVHFEDNSIVYPGETPLRPLASAKLREETIFLYPHAWVLILQPNGDFEIARMD